MVFTLVSIEGHAGRGWMARVKRDLALAGFEPHVTWNDRKTVHVGWARLPVMLLSKMSDPFWNNDRMRHC